MTNKWDYGRNPLAEKEILKVRISYKTVNKLYKSDVFIHTHNI